MKKINYLEINKLIESQVEIIESQIELFNKLIEYRKESKMLNLNKFIDLIKRLPIENMSFYKHFEANNLLKNYGVILEVKNNDTIHSLERLNIYGHLQENLIIFEKETLTVEAILGLGFKTDKIVLQSGPKPTTVTIFEQKKLT